MLISSKVVSDPEILDGKPIVEGTRVPVENIMAAVHAGQSRFTIFRHYPSLPPEGVDVCIEFDRKQHKNCDNKIY